MDDPDYCSSFMDVFDRIFKEKMEDYLAKELRSYHMTPHQRELEMFNFARLRIKEIEEWVRMCFQAEQQIEQQRVTKLENEAAARSNAEVQKELLSGRYRIRLRSETPYHQKIVKLAQEPVAFHLYK